MCYMYRNPCCIILCSNSMSVFGRFVSMKFFLMKTTCLCCTLFKPRLWTKDGRCNGNRGGASVFKCLNTRFKWIWDETRPFGVNVQCMVIVSTTLNINIWPDLWFHQPPGLQGRRSRWSRIYPRINNFSWHAMVRWSFSSHFPPALYVIYSKERKYICLTD